MTPWQEVRALAEKAKLRGPLEVVNARTRMAGLMRDPSVSAPVVYTTAAIKNLEVLDGGLYMLDTARLVVAAVNLIRDPAFIGMMGRVEAMAWRPIESCPNTGEVVMFHVPGKTTPFIERADDWHHKAYWLEGTTHWMPLPAPPALEGRPNG
jgi:hypothetical protein